MSRHKFALGNTAGRANKGKPSAVKGRKHPPDCAHCAAVNKGWNSTTKSGKKLHNQHYLATHREEIKSQRAAYRASHRLQLKAVHAQYHAVNRERLLAAKAQDYLKNRERRRALGAIWQAEHPAQASSYRHARRLRKLGRTVGDTKDIWRWEQSWRTKPEVLCHWCQHIYPGRKCHADHVVALALGGEHALSNLVIACASCNRRKRSMPLDRWLKKIGRGA